MYGCCRRMRRLIVAHVAVRDCNDIHRVLRGGLSPAGSAFYSFTVTNAGAVSITLASTTAAKVGAAAEPTLSLSLGHAERLRLCRVDVGRRDARSQRAVDDAEQRARHLLRQPRRPRRPDRLGAVRRPDRAHVMIMRTISRAAALLVLAATVGCGNDTTTTTTSPSTTTAGTETFTSSVAVHGSTTRSFAMTTAGTVTVDADDAGQRAA